MAVKATIFRPLVDELRITVSSAARRARFDWPIFSSVLHLSIDFTTHGQFPEGQLKRFVMAQSRAANTAALPG